jgi:hypothetical protein
MALPASDNPIKRRCGVGDAGAPPFQSRRRRSNETRAKLKESREPQISEALRLIAF